MEYFAIFVLGVASGLVGGAMGALLTQDPKNKDSKNISSSLELWQLKYENLKLRYDKVTENYKDLEINHSILKEEYKNLLTELENLKNGNP